MLMVVGAREIGRDLEEHSKRAYQKIQQCLENSGQHGVLCLSLPDEPWAVIPMIVLQLSD